MAHSKAAIARAVRSERGPRLVELALEHQQLLNTVKLPPEERARLRTVVPMLVVREVIYARIEMIQQEIISIIEQFDTVCADETSR